MREKEEGAVARINCEAVPLIRKMWNIQTMMDAREAGMKTYDLFGIDDSI